MSTEKQKTAARKNIKKAQAAAKAPAKKTTTATAKKAPAKKAPAKATKGAAKKSSGMTTAQKNKVADQKFAFPDERKEPLTDASHVRNAISRFDQVEGVSDAERDRAWRRIKTAAKKFGVEVTARGWRQLGDKAKKH